MRGKRTRGNERKREKRRAKEKENNGGKKRRKRRGSGRRREKHTHTCAAMHIPAAACDTLTSSLQ